jgi:hypothetical protein
MAKGDVGSQNYSQGAMGSVPQFGTARGGYQPPFNNPMMGPSFPNMLIQMAMRNQMQQPQMQYQGFPGQQMGGGKGSMGGGNNAPNRPVPTGWGPYGLGGGVGLMQPHVMPRNSWGLTNGSEMNRPGYGDMRARDPQLLPVRDMIGNAAPNPNTMSPNQNMGRPAVEYPGKYDSMNTNRQ